jgi:hypothetical protein
VSRQSTNSFVSPDALPCTLNGQSFAFQKTIDLSTYFNPAIPFPAVLGTQNGLQAGIIRMLYNTDTGQPFGINVNFAGNANFPVQATKIESTGTAGSSTRKVQVLRTYPDLPPVFSSVLFAPFGLSSQ